MFWRSPDKLDIGRILRLEPLSASRAIAKIGVCIPHEIHFFYDQLWSGVLEEAERVSLSGVEFIYRPIQNLGGGDVEAFQELVAEVLMASFSQPVIPGTETAN